MVGRPGFLAGRPPFWFPPQRVVGRCFPSQYLVGSLPRVEFQPLGALCKFLKSVANKGETRHRDGIFRRGDSSMHASIVTQNRAKVGLGFFLLRYLPRLLRSVLTEMGISEDMYNPLAMFLLVFLVLAGAWLGFWVVHKLVMTEDGLIDIGVSKFVAWSIWIIASVMILQSSVDPLLAAEALLCGVVVRRITRSRFIRHLYKNLRRTIKHSHRYQIPGSSPSKDSYDEYVHNIWKPNNSGFLKPRSRHFTKVPSNSPIQGLIRTPPSQLSDSETHYSSFHKTPERRKFSKDEWEKFTKDSTKKALEELVSSPDFSKWAVINAERITLSPKKDTPDQPFKRIPWF
ncbi:unnamed protein product [Camellia sinensis]